MDVSTTQALIKLASDAGFGVVAGAMLLGWFMYHSRRQESRFDRLFDRLIGDKSAADTPAGQRHDEVAQNGTTIGLAEQGSRLLRLETRIEEVAQDTASGLANIAQRLDTMPCGPSGQCPVGARLRETP